MHAPSCQIKHPWIKLSLQATILELILDDRLTFKVDIENYLVLPATGFTFCLG